MNFHLRRLQTINFRNLSSNIINFSPHINCITGENGHGKTNILEAVYLLANRRSFRKNAGFAQYVGVDSERLEVNLSSIISNGIRDCAYTGRLLPYENCWSLDTRRIRKDYPLKAVFISPFDSNTFHTSKTFRRDWFDHHIAMIDPGYKKVLSRYFKALKFKNSLLVTRPKQLDAQLNIIDNELSACIEKITMGRIRFLSQMADEFERIFHCIFSSDHSLEIILKSPFYGKEEREIAKILNNTRLNDKKTGFSSCGVHRDDYLLLFDGFNSFEYCSLGQQKTAFLGLLFAYIQLFRYIYNTFPIVLIDDISGELDRVRWRKLVQFLQDGRFQVLMTTANRNFNEELQLIEDVSLINVKRGVIFQ